MLFFLELFPFLRSSCDYPSCLSWAVGRSWALLCPQCGGWAIGSASPTADGADSLQDAHRAQLGFLSEVSPFLLPSDE